MMPNGWVRPQRFWGKSLGLGLHEDFETYDRLQYIEFLNFARLNYLQIFKYYKGFCNSFSTAPNSAVPAVSPEVWSAGT
jgi:hypothetical protein